MCGIALTCEACRAQPVTSSSADNLSLNGALPLSAVTGLLPALQARGPDHLCVHTAVTSDSSCRLELAASLLQLRGQRAGTSPGISREGHVLCFNGEVFGGLSVPPGENDGSHLLEALAHSGTTVPEVLGPLRGPWALIFWDPCQQRLWFGRDVLGRRSLLAHFPDAADPRFTLSSVSELPTVTPPPLAAPAPAPPSQAPVMTCRTPATQECPPAAVSAAAELVAVNLAAVAESAASPVQEQVSEAESVRSDPSGRCKAPGKAGRGLGAAAGPGADDAEEEKEPSGFDGYWTELPPGLYSIDFSHVGCTGGSCLHTEGSSGAEVVPGGTGVHRSVPSPSLQQAAAGAVDGGEASTGVRPPHPDLDSRQVLRLGEMRLQVVRHPWFDPLLRDLESYRRVEAVCLAPGDVSQGGSGGAEASEDCVHQGMGSVKVAAADGAGGRTEDGDGERETATRFCCAGEEQQLRGAEAEVLGTCPPRPLIGGPEEAVRALLNVLLAAVRVRCACVQTRSPHPSAAYAAAASAAALAAAAQGAAPAPLPQPSWRRQDPLDFRTDPWTRSASTGLCPPEAMNGEGVYVTGFSTAPAGVSAASGSASVAGQDPVSAGFGSATAAAAPAPEAVTMVAGMTASAAPAAPVLILFSGGVDSVLLAALAHRALPLHVPIDLSNVCFAGGTSPDREAARAALQELAGACPGRIWRLVEVDALLEDVDRHRSRLLALLRPAGTVMDVNIGAALWLAVSGQGTVRTPLTAIAASAEVCVAATDPATVTSTLATQASAAIKQRSQQSVPAVPVPGQFYGSPARVVLLGHGADEQCGGYGRHRTRFRSGGWAGLGAELEVDVRRLWLRNLGRDDRLVSDWGREARHPFLDEDVMGLLLRLPLDCILDLGLPGGQGDKRILRAALQHLGLPQAAARVKRAIQFGSRIGKLSNRRDFGSNRAANRKNAGGIALQDVDRAAADVAAGAWVKPPPNQVL